MSGRIVVGVDASPESAAALRWGYDEARRRGATLDVVHVWSLPLPGDPVGALVASPHVFKRAAGHLLDATVDATLGDAGDVRVVRTLLGGEPARVLVSEAAGADLLVVGSRGHGGFVGLLLGSVSQHCLASATCPVVVVRPPAAASVA